jgi:hypothetical protein
MRVTTIIVALLTLVNAPATVGAQSASRLRFAVTFPAERSSSPLDGRLLLMISADTGGDPRTQVSATVSTAQVFGVDVDGWKPGEVRYIDASAFGYPLRSLNQLKSGRYRVQAMINRYETFRRSDGHTVKLPPDKWEGQQFASKPGNLYSRPANMVINASSAVAPTIVLDQEIPPVGDFKAKETKYVKYMRIRSDLLSKFWGRDMFLGAWILLPYGFDEHPDARYPLVINHGHFPSGVGNWRETPPDPDLKPDYSERFSLAGYNRIQQHATPYYDDSYAVNSANNGPYGDAIMKELIPAIEKQYRAIGAGWARFTFGGSTGGWEAMAVQMFYPDDFNGAWIACPDPIDFRQYTVVNIYEDDNAYYREGPFLRVPRPGLRNYLGHVQATMEQLNHRELALGTKSRSGDQWDVWESVYSPVGADGYPKPIWDKLTGKIDRTVAEHWRQNYDLSYILKRDWKTLGPKVRGKMRIYVGDMDNYYLNNAVYLTEQVVSELRDPSPDFVFDYGDRDEHCWNGDHTRSNAYSRLRYAQMTFPWFVERMLTNSPAGADLRSWRY